jgi:hypothetical protein
MLSLVLAYNGLCASDVADLKVRNIQTRQTLLMRINLKQDTRRNVACTLLARVR